MSELRVVYKTEPTPGADMAFWQMWLQSLLNQVDTLERMLGVTPRTAEIRQWYRQRNQR